MAKKKNASKKHKFKHAEQSLPSQGAVEALNQASVAVATAKKPVLRSQTAVSQASLRDFSYVVTDVRRIAVFAVALVLLEVALWYLFSHTGVGSSIYKLVGV